MKEKEKKKEGKGEGYSNLSDTVDTREAADPGSEKKKKRIWKLKIQNFQKKFK